MLTSCSTAPASRSEMRVKRRISWVVMLLMLGVGAWMTTSLLSQQQRAQQAEQRFALALQGSGQGLWLWEMSEPVADLEGSASDYVWYSPRFRELLQVTEAEFPASLASFISRLHPDDRVLVTERILAHVRGDSEYYSATYRLRIGNTERYRWFRARGVLNADAHVLAGSIIDVNEEVNQRDRIERLVMSAGVAMIMCDEDSRVTLFNPAAELLLGWQWEEIKGKPVLLLVAEEHKAMHSAKFAAAAARLRSLDGDYTLSGPEVIVSALRKDGARQPVRLQMRGIKYGNAVEFVATMHAYDADAPAEQFGAPRYNYSPQPLPPRALQR